MTSNEMFERVLSRPRDYFKREPGDQWRIDDRLGILDWDGNMSEEQLKQFKEHFGLK